MQTNEVPTSAPGDRAPTSEEPAPIKMTNQQTELDQAMPVRTRSPHALTLGPRGLTRDLRPPDKAQRGPISRIPTSQYPVRRVVSRIPSCIPVSRPFVPRIRPGPSPQQWRADVPRHTEAGHTLYPLQTSDYTMHA